MKTVILKQISFSYFKGIRSLVLDFLSRENFLSGKNEAGKTTVFDGLWFLFFGKDSSGRADFSIKTFDENNNVIEKVNHEVIGLFEIDGKTREFRRVYKEIWGKSTEELKGHTTDFYIDGFPVRTEGEYKAAVSELFTEDLFKLLTNPLFFNSMKTTERRDVLINLAGRVSDAEIFESVEDSARNNPGLLTLQTLLAEGKKLDHIKLKAAKDKKAFEDEKKEIKPRIDEAIRSKPSVYNYEELQSIIEEKRAEIQAIQREIDETNTAAAAKNKAVETWEEKIFDLKGALRRLEFAAREALQNAQNAESSKGAEVRDKIASLKKQAGVLFDSIDMKKTRVARLKQDLEATNRDLERTKGGIQDLLKEYREQDAKVFAWDGESCQACGRAFEGKHAHDKEEEARAKFNTAKLDSLAKIEKLGGAQKERKKRLEAESVDLQGRISTLEEEIRAESKERESLFDQIGNLESALESSKSEPSKTYQIEDFLSPEALTIKGQIEGLESQKPEEIKLDHSEKLEKKQALETEIEGLTKALGTKEQLEKLETRIEELKADEKRLADRISEQQGIEYACMSYSKARISLIEHAINSKFELVRFKMFEKQLNGEDKEICDTLYKGVPFPDLNTAGKIQAGLDIIKTLSEAHKLYLPIFIDNRESVHRIPKLQSQVVNLVAKEGQEFLEVTSEFSPAVVAEK